MCFIAFNNKVCEFKLLIIKKLNGDISVAETMHSIDSIDLSAITEWRFIYVASVTLVREL